MKNTYSKFSQIGRIAGVGAVIVMSFLVVSEVRAVTMPVPTMTWVYPNTDMEFEIGKTYPLQWTGVNPTDGNYMVNIGFERVGAPVPFSPGSYGMIGMGYTMPLSGSWNWKAGYTGSSNNLRIPDGQYRLVAVLYSFSQNRDIARDYSDGIITVTSNPTIPAPVITPPAPLMPSVTVLAPGGGETLTIGATTTVAWEAVNPVPGNYMVNLGIERIGGRPFEAGSFGIIDGGLRFPLSGTHEWKVGMTGSDGQIAMSPGNYRLAVVLYSFKTNSDLVRGYSEPFTIVAPTSTPSSTSQGVDESQSVDSTAVPAQTDSPQASNADQAMPSSEPAPNSGSTRSTPVIVESTPPVPIVPPPTVAEDAKMRGMSEQITALRAQLEALQNAHRAKAQIQPPLTPKIGTEAVFTRNLRFGMRNDGDVRALQELLAREGLYAEEVTGNFLGITRKAVAAFQEKYGIDTTGFAGPLTRGKLNELSR